MQQNSPKYGLIFDFDGLIIDTEWPIYAAWKQIYEDHGQELAVQQWGICVGNGEMRFNPYEDLTKKTGRELDETILHDEHLRLFREIIKMKPLPGVEGVILSAKSKGWRISVASSSPYFWVHENLEKLGLREHFEIIKSSDDVEKTKPDPALFKQAMEAMGTLPENTFVFEDSPHGLVAADRAGAFGIAVPNNVTKHLDLSAAKHRVESLAVIDLDELIQLREAAQAGK